MSELVNLVLTRGPQTIERRNDSVIVLSLEEYKKLLGKKPSLIEYIMKGPSFKDLDLKRDKSKIREIEL